MTFVAAMLWAVPDIKATFIDLRLLPIKFPLIECKHNRRYFCVSAYILDRSLQTQMDANQVCCGDWLNLHNHSAVSLQKFIADNSLHFLFQFIRHYVSKRGQKRIAREFMTEEGLYERR